MAKCAECKGTQMVSCPECEGEKDSQCPACCGTGEGAYGNTICRKCDNGSGEITCTNCDENGEIECSMCKDGSDG